MFGAFGSVINCESPIGTFNNKKRPVTGVVIGWQGYTGVCCVHLIWFTCWFHHFCLLFGKKPKSKRLCWFAIFVSLLSCTRSGPTRFVTTLAIGYFRLLVDSFLLFRYLAENTTKNISKHANWLRPKQESSRPEIVYSVGGRTEPKHPKQDKAEPNHEKPPKKRHSNVWKKVASANVKVGSDFRRLPAFNEIPEYHTHPPTWHQGHGLRILILKFLGPHYFQTIYDGFGSCLVWRKILVNILHSAIPSPLHELKVKVTDLKFLY